MTSSNDFRPTTLVLGATGRHGRTGARIVEQLLAGGHNVRALARSTGEHTDALIAQGAEVVVGDLLDRRTLGEGVDGVDSVYFTYPIAEGVLAAAANLASVLRAGKLSPRFVVMSMGVSVPESPSALGRAQWAAEEVLSWAGLEPVVLRLRALFYENIQLLHGGSIRATGRFANSFGSGRAPWISGQDAADLAVAALLAPVRYPAGTISYPTGVEVLSHKEIAEVIAAEIGSPVEYTPVSRAAWQAELEAGSNGGVINPAMAQHISAIGEAFSVPREGVPVPESGSADVKALLGRAPLSFAEFVRVNRTAFARN
ncbi:NmrA family NAD(P)-binding protein [Nocardia sp. NPDC020380]|uniref:NmrA family NAD(P)-binding protein n=1 Tax=Nocardia sp. NPDC020380 TaxID=3364309 RepID=UPI003788F6E4